jgi:hypothetical protein
LLVNPDGSVDVYFGSKPPIGKEANWVQTIPGKGSNTLLRLYSPLEPWFNKTWRPGENRTDVAAKASRLPPSALLRHVEPV